MSEALKNKALKINPFRLAFEAVLNSKPTGTLTSDVLENTARALKRQFSQKTPVSIDKKPDADWTLELENNSSQS